MSTGTNDDQVMSWGGGGGGLRVCFIFLLFLFCCCSVLVLCVYVCYFLHEKDENLGTVV